MNFTLTARFARSAGFAAFGGVAVFPGAAMAAQILVPQAAPTLQAAIDQASPGDVIVLAPGVYTGTSRIIAKAITIEGGGAAILDGNGLPGSVLSIEGVSSGTVNLRGLTIRNGAGTIVDSPCWPFGPEPYGGGVRIVSSSVNLNAVQLSANTATLGGALWYENGSTVTLDGCTVSDNLGGEIAAAVGGCWFGTPSTLAIRNSTISRNHLVTFQGRFGIVTPGIGNADIQSTVFEDNFDTAGVLQSPNAVHTINVNACTFRNNQRWAGSIFATQGTSASSLAVSNTLFENEFGGAQGGRGGIVIITSSTSASTIRDCTFRNVVTNGIELILQAGGSTIVERCRMDDMPNGGMLAFGSDGASITARDIQSVNGAIFVGLRGASTARLDRVSALATSGDAFTLNLTGSSTAEFSSILAAESLRKGMRVVVEDPDQPGQPPTRIRLTNMTLTNNFIGLDLGAVFFGQVALDNSIIAGNSEADYLPTLDAERTTASNCLINGGIYPGTGLFQGEPRFVAPFLGDYRLAADSPAIDAGSNALLLPDMLLDLAGNPRRQRATAAVQPRVDLGAYEFTPSVTACTPSDVAGANQSVGPDGLLTADDIIVFLGWFFASDTRANIAGPDQSTTPDSNFTADDIIVFLGRYFAGC